MKGSAPLSQVYDEVFEEAGGLLNFVAFQMSPGTESKWRMSNIKEGKFKVKTNCTTSCSSRKDEEE